MGIAVNVACVRYGTEFSVDYVNNLYAMVSRHLRKPFLFHCLTDDPAGLHPDIIFHMLPRGKLTGWWTKFYLFQPGQFHGPVIYFDLDTIITDSIDFMPNLGFAGKFWTLEDLGVVLDPQRYTGRVGSGVMQWYGQEKTWIYRTFMDNPDRFMGLPDGDQQAIQQMAGGHISFYQHAAPRKFVSFKYQAYDGPGDAAVVCYHGLPRPHHSIDPNLSIEVYGRLYHHRQWVADHWHSKDIS